MAFKRTEDMDAAVFGILMTGRERAIICNRIYAGMT